MLLPRAGGERLQRAQSFPKAAAHGQRPPKANSVGCTCLSPLLCLFCAGLCDAIPGNELSHHPAACPSPFPPLLRGAAGAQDNTLTRWGGALWFLEPFSAKPSIQGWENPAQSLLLPVHSHSSCHSRCFPISRSVSSHFPHGEQGFHYQQCPFLAALAFMAVLLFYSQFCRVPSS